MHGNESFGTARSYSHETIYKKMDHKRLFVRTVVDTLTGTVHFAVHDFGAGVLGVGSHWETMRVSIPDGTRRLRPAVRLAASLKYRLRFGGAAEELHYSYRDGEHPAREAGVDAVSVYDATIAQLRRRQELRVRLARARGDEGEALRLEQGGRIRPGQGHGGEDGSGQCVVS